MDSAHDMLCFDIANAISLHFGELFFDLAKISDTNFGRRILFYPPLHSCNLIRMTIFRKIRFELPLYCEIGYVGQTKVQRNHSNRLRASRFCGLTQLPDCNQMLHLLHA